MPTAAIALDDLEHWMDSIGVGSGPIEDAQMLSGGTQNQLMWFRRNETPYVLRRPPVHLRANSNETMRRESRMLGALSSTTIPHPRLIASCGDEDVLGAAFYLMSPVVGFNPSIALPPFHASSSNVRRRMGLALVEGIAALGSLDYLALGLEGFGKPDRFLERQVSRWRSQLASYAEFDGWTGEDKLPGVGRISTWLEDNRPPDAAPGILHGDYQLSNVMYRNDSPELAAIVDWELTTIGDPMLDLGWLMATWPTADPPEIEAIAVEPWDGFPTPDELVAHYRRHSDRDLSAIDWYAVLACFKLGVILEGSHARACAGQAPREIGDLLHAKCIGLFERALRWIV